MSSASEAVDRQPEAGDISISPFPGGYVIGRILDLTGADRMWEYIGDTPHVAEAYQVACQHAAGHAVWFCEGPTPVQVDCLTMMSDNGPQRA